MAHHLRYSTLQDAELVRVKSFTRRLLRLTRVTNRPADFWSQCKRLLILRDTEQPTIKLHVVRVHGWFGEPKFLRLPDLPREGSAGGRVGEVVTLGATTGCDEFPAQPAIPLEPLRA